MKRILFAVAALAACGLDAAAASMPSFNCDRAFSPDEITICNSEELSYLDLLMNGGYVNSKDILGTRAANAAARAELGLRHACGYDGLCIRRVQENAIARYQSIGALSIAAPAYVPPQPVYAPPPVVVYEAPPSVLVAPVFIAPGPYYRVY